MFQNFIARLLQKEPQQWMSTMDLTYLSLRAPQPDLPTPDYYLLKSKL